MTSENRSHRDEVLSLDACLELLSNRQRRVVLQFFIDSDSDHASVDELIAEIIEDEAQMTGKRPGHDSIAATLFHVHLPKFADAGILEYDTHHLDVHYRGDSRTEELYRTIRNLK